MKPTLIEVLGCPVCGGGLRLEDGALLCASGHGQPGIIGGPSGAAGFEVRDGVPRMLTSPNSPSAAKRTVAAFERQWLGYGQLRRIFGKDPLAMGANLHGPRLSTRIDPGWYAGKRILDAGCGHGRYLPAFAAMGAEVVGLDIGRGPELVSAAYAETMREDPRMHFVQGSVLEPPFQPGSFDLVFSDGVIHHTPDAAEAYAALARLVKPGGAFYVWVYPQEGPLREAVFGLGRAFTTRLPGYLVRVLSFALAPLTLGIRSYSGTHLGRATWAECAQVVHDWIAPPLQSHHTQAEVSGWAQAAGLEDLETLPIPTGLTAWRPLSG